MKHHLMISLWPAAAKRSWDSGRHPSVAPEASPPRDSFSVEA